MAADLQEISDNDSDDEDDNDDDDDNEYLPAEERGEPCRRRRHWSGGRERPPGPAPPGPRCRRRSSRPRPCWTAS